LTIIPIAFEVVQGNLEEKWLPTKNPNLLLSTVEELRTRVLFSAGAPLAAGIAVEGGEANRNGLNPNQLRRENRSR